MNVAEQFWGVCHRDRTRWYLEENLTWNWRGDGAGGGPATVPSCGGTTGRGDLGTNRIRY